MKLFRFMSKKEFDSYIKGKPLINTYKHKAHTTSIGFCFLKYNKPEDVFDAYKFLYGIVDDEIVAVFETDKSNVSKSYALYHKPGGNFFEMFIKEEYCTVGYEKETFKLIKWSENIIDDEKLYDRWCDGFIRGEDNFIWKK